MRTLSTTLVALALILAGAYGANAQCGSACPTAACPTPPPCDTRCPSSLPPCPGPCTVAQSPCTAPCPITQPSIPAAVGSGPASSLADIPCEQFDKAYMEAMYQLNTSISALTTLGIEQTTNNDLRGLSGKMRYERTKDNQKLAGWYRCMGFGKIGVDYDQVSKIVDEFSDCTGNQFNADYAATMSALLCQQKELADLAIERSSCKDIQEQARNISRSAFMESGAMSKWVDKAVAGKISPPNPVCPTPCSASSCPKSPPCPTACPTPCPKPCPAPATCPTPAPTPGD